VRLRGALAVAFARLVTFGQVMDDRSRPSLFLGRPEHRG
jgi:hypothetical protein